VAALAANTVQIRTDGLPPLRSTEQQGSEYSRGGGGRDAGLGPLWPPVRAHHHLSSPYLKCIGPCGDPVWGTGNLSPRHFCENGRMKEKWKEVSEEVE
jgi:hypothetical protein